MSGGTHLDAGGPPPSRYDLALCVDDLLEARWIQRLSSNMEEGCASCRLEPPTPSNSETPEQCVMTYWSKTRYFFVEFFVVSRGFGSTPGHGKLTHP